LSGLGLLFAPALPADREGGGARTKNLAEKIAALNEKRGRYQAMLAQLRPWLGNICLTEVMYA
jgi:hypothetical protein